MSLLSFLNSPITLAAAAVIAIGVIVYEIVSHQKEERVPSGGRGRGPRPPPDNRGDSGPIPPRPRPPTDNRGDRRPRPLPDNRGDSGPRPPPDGDSWGSGSPYSSNRNNKGSIRQRKIETKPCSESKLSKHDEMGKLPDGSKDSTPNSEFDGNNYYKNVFDKIENDIKNINKENDEKKTFNKNIHDDVSNSLANSASADLNETKLINTHISDGNKEDSLQNAQCAVSKRGKRENVCIGPETNPSNFNDPICSTGKAIVNAEQNYTNSSANITPVDSKETVLINTHTSDVKEEDFLLNTQGVVRKRCKRENACNSPETNPESYNDPSSSTGETAQKSELYDTEADNPLCRACEDELANAVVYPCKHCCLCTGCATIVYRIYKKCSICESDIDYFETLEKQMK